MTSHDDWSEKSDRPVNDAERPEDPRTAAQRRYVAPPTGWAAVAAWSYWRHNPWTDPPLLTVPASDDDGVHEGRTQRDSGDGTAPHRHHESDRRGTQAVRCRRIVAVIVIELLAVFGIVGAIVSSAAHDARLGVLALGIAIVANVVLWLWARTLRRHETVNRRDTTRRHP